MELAFKNKESVLSMAISPDGKWLAVGKIVDEDRNPSLTIWDTATWKCVAEEEAGNVSSIVSLSFNRHSSTLAYLTAADHIRFFDLKDMYLTREMGWDKPYKVCYGVHEDLLMVTGRDLSILDKDDVEVFNYSEYKAYEDTEGLSPESFGDYYNMSDRLAKISYRNKPVVAVFLKEDNAVIITGNNDDKFSVYDIKSGERTAEYPGGIIQASYMEVDKAEKHLLVIGYVPYADLMWELPEMKRVLSENMNEEFPGSSAFRFHPSSGLFAFGGSGGKVFLRSIETGEFLMGKGIHKGEVRALEFSADGKTLISGSADGRVVLTDITEYLT